MHTPDTAAYFTRLILATGSVRRIRDMPPVAPLRGTV